jgi:hypothetical protein
MCFDKETSIITFIIGTVINIFIICYFNETVITLLAIIWQWILLMQLFEAIAWDSQPEPGSKNCSSKNKFAANGALIANITQPIIIALVLISFTTVPTQNKVIAMILLFAYICWLLYAMGQMNPVNCILQGKNCENIDLAWWRDFPGGALPYGIMFAAAILLLLRPMDLAIVVLIGTFGFYLLSSFFYGCGSGSVWCWFAASAPLLTGLYWYSTRGPPKNGLFN